MSDDGEHFERLASLIEGQRRELRALRKELEAVKGRLHAQIVPVGRLADQVGVTRQTIYNRLEKFDIPVRDMHGRPKESGDGSIAYVSLLEWRQKEALATETVRNESDLVSS